LNIALQIQYSKKGRFKMSKIAIISGSPSAASRSAAILSIAEEQLRKAGHEAGIIHVRDLPAEDLIYARWDSPAIVEALKKMDEAEAVVVATPVYKASYTGVLKIFLDLLPQKGLENKVVLPIAVGGTIAHLLSIDYALKPVLSALGASNIVKGIYILDSQITVKESGGIELQEEIAGRLDTVLSDFSREVHWHQRKAPIKEEARL
jgi:FMN reductase